MEEQEENTWTIIRGISTQTGMLGGGRGGGLEEEIGRRSKDGKINGEERKFVGELEKVGWGILNVSIDGNEGEFTYMGGREESVIDYVVRQIKVRERMLKMEKGDCVESDHHPLIISLERREERAKKRKKEREEERGTENGQKAEEKGLGGVEWNGTSERIEV